MTNRENVIKRLEECLSASCRGFRTCPYSDNEWDAVEAALALLGEQEDMIPITVVAECLAKYAAPPIRSPLALYGDLVTAWEEFLKDLNKVVKQDG